MLKLKSMFVLSSILCSAAAMADGPVPHPDENNEGYKVSCALVNLAGPNTQRTEKKANVSNNKEVAIRFARSVQGAVSIYPARRGGAPELHITLEIPVFKTSAKTSSAIDQTASVELQVGKFAYKMECEVLFDGDAGSLYR
jgi:hypothetical protein